MNIGYNRHPSDNDEASFLAHCQALQPSALVIMGAPTFASELADLLPDTRVIFRDWPDGTLAEVADPVARVNRMAAACPNPRVILYTNNEPHPSGAQKWAEWTVTAMQRADYLGRRLCVGNWSVGTPEPDTWLAEWRPVLSSLQGTDHLLGLHEYQAMSWGWDFTPWLVGRYQNVLDACRTMGFACPRIVITECGMDGNLSSDKGWKTAHLTEGEYADYMADMIDLWRWPVVGACIFSWGNSGGWDAFDVSQAQTFQRRMVELAATPTPEPPPIPELPPTTDLEARLATLEQRIGILENMTERVGLVLTGG